MTSRRAVKASSAGLLFDAIAAARTMPADCKKGMYTAPGVGGCATRHSKASQRASGAVPTGGRERPGLPL